MSYSVHSLTNFIFESISSNTTVVNSGIKVFREKFISEDINTLPAVYIHWAGETVDPENSLIGSPVAHNTWSIQIDYTFYLQHGNYNRNPTQTVEKLHMLWDTVYDSVIEGIVNSSQTLGCTVNPVTWNRIPDQRGTTDLKTNRQTIFSDIVGMTFQVYG